MNCPSSSCGSSNVQSLPHYWQSLSSDSPLKAEYAPPDVVEGQYLSVAGVVVLGIVAVVSGAVMAGLVAVAAGLVWGAARNREAVASVASHASWSRSRICLACTGQF